MRQKSVKSADSHSSEVELPKIHYTRQGRHGRAFQRGRMSGEHHLGTSRAKVVITVVPQGMPYGPATPMGFLAAIFWRLMTRGTAVEGFFGRKARSDVLTSPAAS